VLFEYLLCFMKCVCGCIRRAVTALMSHMTNCIQYSGLNYMLMLRFLLIIAPLYLYYAFMISCRSELFSDRFSFVVSSEIALRYCFQDISPWKPMESALKCIFLTETTLHIGYVICSKHETLSSISLLFKVVSTVIHCKSSVYRDLNEECCLVGCGAM
jgi:hypothetical protein